MDIADRESYAELDFKQRRALLDQQLVSEAHAGSSSSFAQLQTIFWRQFYRKFVAI